MSSHISPLRVQKNRLPTKPNVQKMAVILARDVWGNRSRKPVTTPSTMLNALSIPSEIKHTKKRNDNRATPHLARGILARAIG